LRALAHSSVLSNRLPTEQGSVDMMLQLEDALLQAWSETGGGQGIALVDAFWQTGHPAQ